MSFVGFERGFVRPPLCTVSHPVVSSLSNDVGSSVRVAIRTQSHLMNSAENKQFVVLKAKSKLSKQTPTPLIQSV